MMEEKNRKKQKIELWTQSLFFLAVTVSLLIFGLMTNDFAPKSSQQARVEIGLRAPDFTFTGIDGNEVSLSDYLGKVVIVNIWATWCPPCVDEMPSMEKLYKKFKVENFEILAVSIDESGREAVIPFMRKYELTFPALIDSQATIKNLYGATGVPESFIIDKKGICVKKIIGSIDWAAPEVFSFFQELLQR